MSTTLNNSRVWLVTGCSSGFGLELVHSILARGDKVIATARSVDKLSALSKAGAATLQLDVTSSLADLQATAEKAIAVYGKVDILVNNAAFVLQGAIEECR
jgi:NAD(P)-dependent dehydrogenase (short-subunit alcohol dehydrogenase family)